VTVPQIICLEALSDKGLMTVAVLAGYVHLAPSTIVGIIDRLEAKKFVTRTRDNIDRRTVFVQITETGRNFIASSPHLLHNRLHNNLQQLAESEQIQIANSLDRLVTLMKD